MKNYSDMTDEELSAAKQALDVEINKLRQERKEDETTAEKEERVSKVAQLRFAKADIQQEQDRRFVPINLDEGHALGVSGVAPTSVMGVIGGSPEPPVKQSKTKKAK
jgi:hypothetical protein